MGDHYVLVFVPALRFLQSQILCRLYESPSDETINRGPPVCIHMQTDPVVHVKVRWIMELKHQNDQDT